LNLLNQDFKIEEHLDRLDLALLVARLENISESLYSKVLELLLYLVNEVNVRGNLRMVNWVECF